MSELEVLAAEFKKWRGNRSRCHYPKSLWGKALKLTEHYPLRTVAETLEISIQSLKGKCQVKPLFKPVQVVEAPNPVSIEFPTMIVHFQASHEQLVYMVQTLLKTKP